MTRRLWVFALVAIGLLVVVGAFGYSKVHKSSSNKNPELYSYTKLQLYSQPGFQQNEAHDGLTFFAPVEFNLSTRNNPVNNLTLVHKQTGAQNRTLATINTASSPRADTSQSYLDRVNNLLERHQSQVYINNKNSYKRVLQSVIGAREANIDLSDPHPLVTKNLPVNAWQFDFSVKSQNTPGSSQGGQPGVHGKFVLAFGQKTQYRFIVASLTPNWQPNSDVWQQVINSIKIDQ